jgi:hypothetical protein
MITMFVSMRMCVDPMSYRSLDRPVAAGLILFPGSALDPNGTAPSSVPEESSYRDSEIRGWSVDQEFAEKHSPPATSREAPLGAPRPRNRSGAGRTEPPGQDRSKSEKSCCKTAGATWVDGEPLRSLCSAASAKRRDGESRFGAWV